VSRHDGEIGSEARPIQTTCFLAAMHSDGIVLIAAIAPSGPITAAVTLTHVQGGVATRSATASQVPMGPIDKKSAAPGSKATNVFLLTGR
jgi:hypothetical protein